MHDLLHEVLSQTRSAWRFRWWGVAVAWLVALLGFGWVAIQRDIYEASTRIYVDTSSVLRPLLGNQIVDSDIATRLTFVRQALLGRDYLQQVVVENNLDASAVTEADKEAVLAALALAVNISASSPTNDNNRNRQDSSTIFTIRYRHQDPGTAVGVVSSFKDLLIEDTLGANQSGARTAEEFFTTEIAFYDDLRARAEQGRLEFLRQNPDHLPGAEAGIQTRIQREQEQLDELRRQLRLAESSREELDRQLSGESALSSTSTLTLAEPPPGSIDAQIRAMTAALDQLRLRGRTELHPEVIAARESLAELEAQKAARQRELGVGESDQELSSLSANPVFEAIRIQMNEVDVEIAQLRVDISDREQRLAALNSRINEVLQVEATVAEFDRDIAYYEGKSRELMEAQERQRLSGQAESTDQVEFNVLNPPQAGAAPVAPRRLLLLAGVLAASLGAAGGLCWLLAQLKPVFSTSRNLRELVGLPVLGTVGHVTIGKSARAKQLLSVLSFAGAMCGLILLYGAGVLIEVSGPGIRTLIGGG